MSASGQVQLHIGKAIPHGNEKESRAIIDLWQNLDAFFTERQFTAMGSVTGQSKQYRISLAAGPLVQTLEQALATAGSFDKFRKAHISDAQLKTGADLVLSIDGPDQELTTLESYQVATVFLHQLVIAANISLPGSFQIIKTDYSGAESHSFEAPTFDSRVFYGASKAAASSGLPSQQRPAFEKVWGWLEKCETSKVHTAIKGINKVLFSLLKVAELRHEYSARTVMIIVYQLEMLLDCHHAQHYNTTRDRLKLILGALPEEADCIKELYTIYNSLLHSNQPVHRPPLICHTTGRELNEQTGQHNSAIEQGTALVLELLRDLIDHDALGYQFREEFSRKP